MAVIQELVNKHVEYRQNSINLIASENLMSSTACDIVSESYLSGRYHAEFYSGVRYVDRILKETSRLVSELFNVQHAIVSLLSGNLAVIAALLSFSEYGDSVAILSLEKGGGYPIDMAYFGRKRIDLPFSAETQNIDIDLTIPFLEKEKPSLVFLGASLFLFPHPVREIAGAVHEYGGTVVYDGSHVMGLIAGKRFQDPLAEGADVIIGSTHKSFPGPQGGIILANDNQMIAKLQPACSLKPVEGIVLMDNPHPARIAALGAVAEELLENNLAQIYATQIVKNSKALAVSLDASGYTLKGKNQGFTESHQVLSDINDFNTGAIKRDILHEHGIISDSALRFGTAELTRLGYVEKDMVEIARIITAVLSPDYDGSKNKTAFRQRVRKLVDEHRNIVL
ncbi:MAG: serine hydroxymethyltransferase [Candidatus Hodarchaeales archaeon]